MTLQGIIDYANSVDISEVEEVLERQVTCNSAISQEGLDNPWGARVGKTMLENWSDDVKCCACARAAIVPGATDGERTDFLPSGLGWPLELAEALMAEYGIPFGEAARIPLCRAFALVACVRQRHGGRHAGPDYWERVTMRARKRGVNG